MTKNILFDKFIDVEFTVDPPVTSISLHEGKTIAPKRILFKTPDFGPKPNIAIYVNYLPDGNTQDLTVKITNFVSEIDLAYYKYIKVRAGYKSGKYVILGGEIWNCYMEKPNPEGITIFQCVLGTLADMYMTPGPFVVEVAAEKVFLVLLKIADVFKLKTNIFLPKEWQNVIFPVNVMKTYTWSTALEMRTEVNKILSDMAVINKLPHLYITAVSGILGVYSLTESSVDETTPIIDIVSSAYLAGAEIVVKAPWNPLLTATSLFKMDTKFFRGRMGTFQLGGKLKAFGIFRMSVAFSTENENSMEVHAMDLSLTDNW